MSVLGKFAKAIYATIVAPLTGLAAILVGSETFAQVTDGQWVTLALSGLIAGGGVYGLTAKGTAA